MNKAGKQKACCSICVKLDRLNRNPLPIEFPVSSVLLRSNLKNRQQLRFSQ
jgi:hypothetical protein